MRETETPYSRLLSDTAAARAEFLEIPLIGRTLRGESDRDLYLRFLEQAYHHVRHTCPLMGAALARCQPGDERLRAALIEYLDEEKGHEVWILDDIEALGGDREAAKRSGGDIPVRVLVGYAYYAVEHISPYSLLGMVHVLEGISARLAEPAARAIAAAIGVGEESGSRPAGFSYLKSHGALDKAHVAFFERLVNGIDRSGVQDDIVEMTQIVYRLYGDVFRSLDRKEAAGLRHAS